MTNSVDDETIKASDFNLLVSTQGKQADAIIDYLTNLSEIEKAREAAITKLNNQMRSELNNTSDADTKDKIKKHYEKIINKADQDLKVSLGKPSLAHRIKNVFKSKDEKREALKNYRLHKATSEYRHIASNNFNPNEGSLGRFWRRNKKNTTAYLAITSVGIALPYIGAAAIASLATILATKAMVVLANLVSVLKTAFEMGGFAMSTTAFREWRDSNNQKTNIAELINTLKTGTVQEKASALNMSIQEFDAYKETKEFKSFLKSHETIEVNESLSGNENLSQIQLLEKLNELLTSGLENSKDPDKKLDEEMIRDFEIVQSIVKEKLPELIRIDEVSFDDVSSDDTPSPTTPRRPSIA